MIFSDRYLNLIPSDQMTNILAGFESLVKNEYGSILKSHQRYNIDGHEPSDQG